LASSAVITDRGYGRRAEDRRRLGRYARLVVRCPPVRKRWRTDCPLVPHQYPTGTELVPPKVETRGRMMRMRAFPLLSLRPAVVWGADALASRVAIGGQHRRCCLIPTHQFDSVHETVERQPSKSRERALRRPHSLRVLPSEDPRVTLPIPCGPFGSIARDFNFTGISGLRRILPYRLLIFSIT
jgi:hypothetical protein